MSGKLGIAEWKARLERNSTAFGPFYKNFTKWERLYRGEYELEPVTDNDRTQKYKKHTARHIRRVIAENIEATIDSAIPQPKVQARREEDQELARLIEDMIRNELDRLPMEELNDIMERMVPINGGAGWLVEWDDSAEFGRGAVSVTAIHPQMLCPQNGVYTSVEDMDYIILKVPQTKAYVKARYGKDLRDESESDPGVRDTGVKETSEADDFLTVCKAYYRDDDGATGLFVWVNDTVLEDNANYQARRERVCAKCGAPESEAQPAPTTDGTRPGVLVCPVCGSHKWTEQEMTEENISFTVPGPDGLPGLVSFTVQPYVPSAYPVVIQKNISVSGQLLGESDVEKIADQQNLISRLDIKISDKLVSSGSSIILPPEAHLGIDSKDGRIWHLEKASPEEVKLIDFEGNIAQDMTFLNDQYEAARRILGITDSYQGRRDQTAQSGVAKQFAAAQSAGRLESRRAMKRAAWAHIFELIFKLRLAYTDKDFSVVSRDESGDEMYKTFSRYLFLRPDGTLGPDGKPNFEWNDDFLFSCDADASLANNREARWSDMFNFYSAGTFGNPQDPFSQLLFWQEMRELHYPGAERMVTALRQRMEQLQQQQAAQQQQQAAMQQQQMQAQEQQRRQDMQTQDAQAQRELEIEIDAAARADAARDVGAAFERRGAAGSPDGFPP
ncbi:MAG: hypothetical protein LBK23_04875 [Oscillospiraceae bacterium]|jgi:hypothetical protein|nr:hypothetical protein [Oscillospiraceae bacterium]